jgi:selenocysteine-specific elongation factor
MIVGTAGHIDHGKTTLVRALTGVDTDRLKEEKERGISIELGYAYVPLDRGLHVSSAQDEVLGFVDVPGHERLVHTMAAGACGIDFALLVIAADDGVMPQTREHVAILELFGITRAAVALTKVDCVDDARVPAVRTEIGEFLAPTTFARAPVFPVNAVVRGDGGTEALREYLHGVAARDGRAAPGVAGSVGPTGWVGPTGALHPAGALGSTGEAATTRHHARDTRRSAQLFRLAVDRVFTLAGHGTVVAGTVFSGSVRTGDMVALFPSSLPARVRSIHAQNRPADMGRCGQRCALNLAGIDKQAIKRGDWIADSRLLAPTSRIDVRINLLPDGDIALKAWTPVHFHHGASHQTAHVVPLEGVAISSGHAGHAQLAFDAPLCAMPGDRFILRDAQAARTIGGGIVLDPFAPSRKRRSTERLRYLRALERMIAGDSLTALLAEAPYGIKLSELVRLTGEEPAECSIAAGIITIEGAHDRYVFSPERWQGLRERAVGALREFHADQPDEPGPDAGRLHRMALPQIPDDLWRRLVADLTADRTIYRSGPWLHLPGHAVTLSEGERMLALKLQPLIVAGRFDPPWVRDLAATINEPEDSVRRVLRKQVTQGAVFQVVHDLFYDRQSIGELATVISKLAREHGTVEAARYRDAVGLGRKRAIQILEFFDRVGHTRRMRDSHVLRADSEWRGA